jgi:hypothetical protein
MLLLIFLFSALVAQNQTATYTKQYEQNEHTINAIYLKWHSASLRNDSITARNALAYKSDIAMLKSIAAQCPYSGGNAVFAARAMLAQQDRTYYDDKALCLEQGILWRTAKPKVEKTSKDKYCKIYPNPANHKIVIEFKDAQQDGNIALYDIYGRILLEQRILNTTTNTLNIEGISSGVYILKVESNGSNVITEKITVIK